MKLRVHRHKKNDKTKIHTQIIFSNKNSEQSLIHLYKTISNKCVHRHGVTMETGGGVGH